MAAPAVPKDIRWVAYGATDGPWSNQLSIEDELAAVTERLGKDRGVLLYAGGAGGHDVQVADAQPRASALMQTLGQIVDPQPGRDAHYVTQRLVPHGAAELDGLTKYLGAALAQSGPPLVVWIAGHGSDGESSSDVTFPTWVVDDVGVGDLTTALSGTRPVRLIDTTCFGGGFADAVIATPNRACGFFATRWYLEASGCDPDPGGSRDTYGPLLLAALADKSADLDGDGKVGLAEAHVRAVLAAHDVEVPMMSSEAFLEREIHDDVAPVDRAEPLLAEERAILEALTKRLKLDEADLQDRYDALADEEEKLEAAQRGADDDAGAARAAVLAKLLARWPALQDPWHPDFGPTLATQRAAIEAFLASDASVAAWRKAEATADKADADMHALRVEFGAVDRAYLALRTMERAAVAKAGVEGTTWATFTALRQCEREALP